MPVLDRYRNGKKADPSYPPNSEKLSDAEKEKADKYVQDCLKRGRDRMKQSAGMRNQCLAFARGEQHLYEGKDGLVLKPLTVQQGMQPWRVRQVRNMLKDVIEHEVSAATQRVPSYSVVPSTLDPEDVAAAQIAQQVALYGYEKWKVRSVMERAVAYAVIADEGFLLPYFDNQVGERITDEYATGEIKIRTLGGNEVYWEPGVQFEDARWYAIEQARPLEEVYALNDYKGGKLEANAKTSDVLNKKQTSDNMVLVTEYFERPCLKKPVGRWLTLANGHVIVPEAAYPLVDAKGKVCDEPVMLRLTYFTDPSSERGEGLVRHLLDAQRTINDCLNKLLEWKNLGLVPRMFIPKGMFDEGVIITDEPGSVTEVNPVGNATAPTFAPTPAIPRELFEMIDQAKADIANISAQNQIPGQVESGRGIQALIEKDQSRRQRFIANLAALHAQLMERCLYLVQRHYTEPRLLLIHGHFGSARIADFLGAQMLGQCDVRVSTASIEPRTRESVEQKVMTYAQLGWITPQMAMAAIDAGISETLADDYEYDLQRANLLIQKIRMGAEALMNEPPVHSMDAQGNPVDVPSWMPRPFDNAQLQMKVLGTWMKTPEYDGLSAEQKEIAMLIYSGYQKLQAQQQAEEAAAQAAQAQAIGQSNASRAPDAPELPTLPGMGTNGAQAAQAA